MFLVTPLFPSEYNIRSFQRFLPLKEPLVATLSEVCAPTSRIYTSFFL